MLIQSDEGEALPADSTRWLDPVTKREPSQNDFLIDSGAACAADGLGGNQMTWSEPQVNHWTSVHHDRQHDDLPAQKRRYQRGG